MSRRAKRGIAALIVSSVLVGFGVYVTVATFSPAATAQSLPDTGKFRAGSELGAERAGFSGRAMVQVFTSAGAREWPAIAGCLQDAAVTAEMDPFFVGVLVDEAVEPHVEQLERDGGGRVIVRGLDGAFLGGLKAGFQCQDLVDLLAAIRTEARGLPEKSPIYARLLETPGPIEEMVRGGETARAESFVQFLKEFEGEASPAAQAAQAKLGR